MLKGNEIRRWLRILLAIAGCWAAAGGARAGWEEESKLTDPNGATGDRFGICVSISGDYAIVGSYYDDANGENSGSAYIFERHGENWLHQATIIGSDTAAGDNFGASVAIDGDYAIVGARFDRVNGAYEVGSAYLFQRRPSDANWIQQAKLTAQDLSHARFGNSVSISGDHVIIGAYGDDDNGENAGAAYIFKFKGEDASWIQKAKLTASDGAAGDNFGCSVSISGGYAIVGAYQDDVNGLGNSGSAYIFEMPVVVGWMDANETAKLTASDGAAEDYFGISVSINGNHAIAGSYWHDPYPDYYPEWQQSGSAYIFKRSDTSSDWTQQAKLIASDGAAADRFGVSVSLRGDLAIIGSYFDDANGLDSGSAYIFKRDGESWMERSKIAPWDGAAKDRFSGSVSIYGECVIVGATRDDDNGEDSGSAYIFRHVCPVADLSGDCWVNFIDFSVLGGQWRLPPGEPSADVGPEGGDGNIDFLDVGVMAGEWLQGDRIY